MEIEVGKKIYKYSHDIICKVVWTYFFDVGHRDVEHPNHHDDVIYYNTFRKHWVEVPD